MTPAETLSVLAYFTAAWPWATVGEHTAEVWAEALTGVDAEHAHTAARRLARTEERPPSIARFRAEVDKLDRDKQPALTAGGSRPMTYDESASVARAIRAGLTAAGVVGAPHGHQHHAGLNGASDCVPCNRTDEDRRADVAEVMSAIREELNR